MRWNYWSIGSVACVDLFCNDAVVYKNIVYKNIFTTIIICIVFLLSTSKFSFSNYSFLKEHGASHFLRCVWKHHTPLAYYHISLLITCLLFSSPGRVFIPEMLFKKEKVKKKGFLSTTILYFAKLNNFKWSQCMSLRLLEWSGLSAKDESEAFYNQKIVLNGEICTSYIPSQMGTRQD